MDWIPNLDATPLALIIMTVSVLVSIVGLWVVARWVRRTTVHAQLDNGAIAGLIAETVGIFAIAAGLTAVAGWGNTADASGRVGQEAAAITVLYHTLGGYPEPFQGEAKARLTEYVHNVIDREWPMLEQGKVLGGGVDVLDSLQRQIFAFAPVSAAPYQGVRDHVIAPDVERRAREGVAR